MVYGDGVVRSLPFNKYLAILYVLVTYISWQLHELGHWTACKILGIDAIFGFNVWKILNNHNFSMLAIIAGPLTNLILAVIGLVLLYFVDSLLIARIGLFLLISNSLIDIGSALISVKHVVVYHSLCSEPTWKLILSPIFLILLYMGVRMYREKLSLRILFIMAILTAILGIVAISIDTITWSCIEHGVLICSPIAGISTIVIIVNIVVTILTIIYILVYRWRLCEM